MGNSNDHTVTSDLDSHSFQNLIVRLVGFAMGTGLAAVWFIAALYFDFKATTKENAADLKKHIIVEQQKIERWDKDYAEHKDDFKALKQRSDKVYYKVFPDG